MNKDEQDGDGAVWPVQDKNQRQALKLAISSPFFPTASALFDPPLFRHLS